MPELFSEIERKLLTPFFTNIDQPIFAKSIRPSALSTSSTGYVRLHGRNYQNWFREGGASAERYNYLYSHDELLPWITRVREVSANTIETYVITNNHFRGKAVVNALEIKSALEERRVSAPAPLLAEYPHLIESVTAKSRSSEGPDFKLFD